MAHGTRVWTALGTVYVIWGSTYLGMETAGRTIPPLFAVGARFAAAGLLMAAFAVWRRGPHVFRVRPEELRAALLVGVLLPGANGILFVAVQHVATGLSALIIGAVPLWIVVFRAATGDRPPRQALVGVVIGFVGVALLVHPSGSSPLGWLLLVLSASLMWALGSFLSGRLPLPRDAFAATAIEMLAGGAMLLPIGALATPPDFSAISGRSVVGWVYLVVFGSVVGYTAYVWLLDNAPIGKVATYAYVNPVVAIALGALVLHEKLTWTIGAGAALVLVCVAFVVGQESVPPEAEAMAAGAAATEPS